MTKIVLKHGTGVPSDTDLEVAEVAIDNVSGAMYTKLADDSVKQLNEGGATAWDDVTGKPTEFPPEAHNHDGVYQPVGDYIEDADSDGKQYARKDGAWSEVVIPEGGTGSSVHIGATPPASPEEGQQWMEVPTSGDAVMWIYDGDKWLEQPGGKDGADGAPGADGNIADATTDGVIATWDNTAGQWTPDDTLIVKGGNVGIGPSVTPYTFSTGAANLTISSDRNNKSGTITLESSDASVKSYLYHDDANGMRIATLTDHPMTLRTNNQDRLTIDSSGNATFSGTVSASNSFVTGNNIWREGHSGLAFGINYIVPRDTDLNPRTSSVDIGQNNDRFKDGHFNGTVYSNGSPLTRTVDLIKTLSTLRNATKDETTLEGLRDAIGNAIGGLIEKFEAMQSAATQEISDE